MEKYHCRWIETHRDGNVIRKLWYLFTALVKYIVLLPFYDIVHIHVATTQSAKRKMLFLYPAKWTGKKLYCIFILQMRNSYLNQIIGNYIESFFLRQI